MGTPNRLNNEDFFLNIQYFFALDLMGSLISS